MRTAVLLLTILLALPLSGCGGSEDGDSQGSGGSGDATSVDITVKGDRVSPSGERVKAKVGAPIRLHIDADEAGELHVHSTPEQEIAFPKGTSTRTLRITQPGVVDVEDHALDQVIVQLQVS